MWLPGTERVMCVEPPVNVQGPRCAERIEFGSSELRFSELKLLELQC